MKYSIITFGCRVNQADSLRIEEGLLARGGVAAPPSDADLVIVNTCSVTASADQGARQTIRRVARDNPSARVVVTGCYASRRPEEVAALPNVVRVVGNDEKDRFFETTAERFGDGDGACGATIAPGVAGRTAFTLRVQTGCDEHCSYCIIPTTRGAGRSVPVDRFFAKSSGSRRRASRKSRSPASSSVRTGAICSRQVRSCLSCGRWPCRRST